MLLSVLPIYCEKYDCYQSNVVNIAKYVNCDYEMMFGYSWIFTYDNNGADDEYKLFGNRIKSNYFFNFTSLLYQYHGLYIEAIKISEIDDLISIVLKENQKKMPVILFTDSYYLKWCPTYKQLHYRHTLTIVDIDEINETISCIDSYFSNEILFLSFAELIGIFNEIGIVSLNKPIQVNFKWYQFLKETISIANDNVMHSLANNIRNFARDFNNNFNLSREMNNDDTLYTSLFLINLRVVKSQRLAFAETLQYLHKRFGIRELNDYSIEMETISKLWERLSQLLIKMSIIKSMEILKDKATNLIYVIANEEEKVMNALVGLIAQYDKI